MTVELALIIAVVTMLVTVGVGYLVLRRYIINKPSSNWQFRFSWETEEELKSFLNSFRTTGWELTKEEIALLENLTATAEKKKNGTT